MNLASVWNDFLAGNFAHIWHGIAHAHWANVWASISAIFTALAVIVAGLAMLRWRKQDELKAKMAFKLAISQYLVSVVKFQNVMENKLEDPDNEIRNKTISDFMECRYAWWTLEDLLDGERDINQAWRYLTETHSYFIQGAIDLDTITRQCSVILSKKFVFK